MRRKISFALTALAAVALTGGILLGLGGPGTASAKDPGPPPGMHQACEKMDPQAMEPMHEGMMNAGGQMGEWMESGEHCPH